MLKFLLRIVHGKHAYDVYMARNFKQCNTIKGYFKQNQTEYEKKYSCIKIFVLKNVLSLDEIKDYNLFKNRHIKIYIRI